MGPCVNSQFSLSGVITSFKRALSFSQDLLFVFSVPKMVEIRDYRLGLLQCFCLTGVVSYIVVYQVFLQNQYMKFHEAQVIFAMELSQLRRLQGATDWSPSDQCDTANNSCRNVVRPISELPYCCNSSCSFDVLDHPDQCRCPWTVPGLKAFFRCRFQDFLDLGNLRMPTRQIVQTFRIHEVQVYNSSCESADLCDRVWLNASTNESYVAGVEDFLLKMDHVLVQEDLNLVISASEMTGALWVEGKGDLEQKLCANPPNAMKIAYKNHPDISQETTSHPPCFLPADFEVAGEVNQDGTTDSKDVYYIKTLLAAAGKDLDRHGLRRNGVVVSVVIEYSNVYGNLPGTGFPQFGTRKPYYFYRVQAGSNTGFSDTVVQLYDEHTRVYEKSYGISLNFVGNAKLGMFDFLTLLEVLVAGLALTGFGAVLTQIVAQYFLSRSRFYVHMMKEVNIDLHGLELLEQLSEEELQENLAALRLPVPERRDRATKIVRALQAGLLDVIGEELAERSMSLGSAKAKGSSELHLTSEGEWSEPQVDSPQDKFSKCLDTFGKASTLSEIKVEALESESSIVRSKSCPPDLDRPDREARAAASLSPKVCSNALTGVAAHVHV